jgi:4'-phosphopantetheinyl transferase EntD
MIQPEIPNIFSFFTEEPVSFDVLWPEETSFTDSFAMERLRTFSAGRFCARKAMELMGHPAMPIPMGDDRAPVWPAGITGSISHTQGLAGALICSTGHHPSIGLDIERRAAVDRSLWDILFDEQELQFIASAAVPDELATLFFSLKESYYKMQYPLTHRFLDFRDVRIEYGPEGVQIKRLRSLPEAAPGHRTGHLFTPGFIITWVLAEG